MYFKYKKSKKIFNISKNKRKKKQVESPDEGNGTTCAKVNTLQFMSVYLYGNLIFEPCRQNCLIQNNKIDDHREQKKKSFSQISFPSFIPHVEIHHKMVQFSI